MTFSLGGAELDRPERLIASARALANETGSAAFTVVQLTGHAGLSLKAFYTCFRSKDDVLLALLGEDSRIGATVPRRSHRCAYRLRRVAGVRVRALRHAHAAGGTRATRECSSASTGGSTELHDDELRVALAPLIDLLANSIDSDDPKRDARTMFGVLLGGIHDVVVGRVTDTDELAALPAPLLHPGRRRR